MRAVQPISGLGTLPLVFRLGIALLLCGSIVIQMLGTPVTLLDPGANADALRILLSEGFSLPSMPPPVLPLSRPDSIVLSQPPVRIPLLAGALFHPPLT